jgi:hypothetical protein
MAYKQIHKFLCVFGFVDSCADGIGAWETELACAL